MKCEAFDENKKEQMTEANEQDWTEFTKKQSKWSRRFSEKTGFFD